MRTRRLRVGVAVDTFNGFGRQIIRGVTAYASVQRKWLLIEEFSAIDTDPHAWPTCDGVITTLSDKAKLRAFEQRCRHVISCSGSAEPALTPIVCMDDQAVGRLAAEHLIDCRVRHFGFYGMIGSRLSENRLSGFRQALAPHGFSCVQAPMTYVWKRPIRRGWQAHWPAVVKWLKQLPKPVGVMCVDDMAAHDLAAACLDAEIPVPDSVAIIGVNNDDLLCEGAWPPLSSVQTDYQRIGHTAAELLERLMAGGRKVKVADRLITLPPVGVAARASTDVLAVDEPQLSAAVRFIREHACDPCSVSDVLMEVPVGRRWLERQFFQKLGRTPHDEINHVRMETAQHLLLRREATISQVAERCGFSTVQSFNRAFHQTTGESPAAFRKARISQGGG